MALNIRSSQVDVLAEKLATQKRVTKTEAVRIALENELRRSGEHAPLWERLKPLRDRVAAAKSTGHPADKAFFDDLSGEY